MKKVLAHKIVRGANTEIPNSPTNPKPTEPIKIP